MKTQRLLLILISGKQMGHDPRPNKVTKHLFNNLFWRRLLIPILRFCRKDPILFARG